MEHRVHFFSLYDMSRGYNLELAEKAIAKYETIMPSDINDVIELFHIKKLLDNDCRLTKWTDDDSNRFKDIVKGYGNIIVKFFRSLSPDKVEKNYETLEWEYRQTFWDIVDLFKLYDIVPINVFKKIAKNNISDLRAILHCRNVVEKYKTLIREILLNDKYAAHILIDKYISRHDNPIYRELFLPQNLTMEDKEVIINNYINSDNPNINYVRLICQNKDEQKNLILSPITKVKADKLAKKLNDELLKDKRTVIVQQNMGIQFSHVEGLPPFSYKDEKDCPTLVYSVKYIEQCNHIQLMANCITLFGWMNKHFLLDLINKNSEVNALESTLFDMSRNAYPAFSCFDRKNTLSCYQLYGYNELLPLMQTFFEQELKIFYEVHLKKEYGYPALTLNYPNIGDSWLNKCRVLFPELDSVVKQYNTYVEYDEIDSDIIKFSKPIKIIDGKSLLINKYYEINNGIDEIWHILRNMFAPGVMLDYVEPYKNSKYHCLYDLLSHEIVHYNNYEEYQKREIDFLITQGVLEKDNNDKLVFVNKEQVVALQSLWEYHSCAYWHYSDDGRKALDEMLAKGWLVTSDYLLTTEERKYFSYYLDNSEFTNGHAYRNHYAHGSTPPVDNENIHQTTYLTLLRLLAILVLKIEDDLWSARRALVIGCIKKQAKANGVKKA